MKIGILPCQGTSNTGVMTSKIGIKFVDEKKASMVCPLGLPLGIEGIINNAKKNDRFIALNGCPMKCASKALDSVEIDDYEELTLTEDFKIKKTKNFHDETGMDDVIEAVDQKIKEMTSE